MPHFVDKASTQMVRASLVVGWVLSKLASLLLNGWASVRTVGSIASMRLKSFKKFDSNLELI